MEIAFCDRCDASIPQTDLERRAAGTRGGALLCAPCLRAARRRRAAWMVLVPLALLAAAVAGAAGAVAVLLPQIRALEASVDDVEREVGEARRPDVGLGEELSGIRELAAAHSESLTGIRTEIRDDLEGLGESVETLSGQVRVLAEEIRTVKERLAEPEVPRPAPAPEPPTEPSTSTSKPPDLGLWLPLLDDEDAGVRLSALIALEDVTDGPVVGKTIDLLADADALVRAQAARMAGRWKESRALPGLAELLSDGNPRVRAQAGEAIAAIQGPVEGYDPTDPEEVREPVAKAFRESLE